MDREIPTEGRGSRVVNGLTVADLHAKLGWLVERGRGGDEVTFSWTDATEEVISAQTREQLQSSDWTLRQVTWSGDDDYFTTLQFEPTHVDRVRSKQIALEEVVRKWWERASDVCLENVGDRKQPPCLGCLTGQLVDVVRVSAEERSDEPSDGGSE